MAPEWNVILKEGPGDGMLIELAETTHTLVWDSPWRPPEPGEYRRTENVEDGRTVFRWVSDSGRPQAPTDPKHGSAG